MEKDKAIELLVNRCYFKPSTAKAYIEYKGCCGYCGADLIDDRTRYWTGTIDHLLARTKYPDYTEDERNHVLCCMECNSLKRDYDLLKPGEDPEEMLGTKKDVLFKRAIEFLKVKRVETGKAWEGVRGIISNVRTYRNFIEELISFYSNKLTYNKLITRRMKSLYWLLIIFIVIYIFSTIMMTYIKKDFFNLIRESPNSPGISIALIIGGTVIFMIILKVSLRESYLIKNKYNNSLDDYRIHELTNFLNTKRAIDINLEKLISVIYRMAEGKKYSGNIFKGSALALFSTILSVFVVWIYNHITLLTEALLIFVLLCTLIFLFLAFKKIIIGYLDSDSDKLKELAKLLEKIYFDREFSNKNKI